tara:strand:- start:699 stop:1508 length:810 start_codon:yes stop_codon:yes gene_type:complete
MQRYALFGHPISHTLSPTIHRYFAQQTQQIIEYQAIDVQPVKFEKTVMEFFQAGGMGANVTAPFKEKALALCDVLSVDAKRAQSVNTLMRQTDGAIFGHNTDGAGLVNHLLHAHVPLKEASVLLLGAGGAAKGALSALSHQPVSRLTLMNRTYEKAQKVLADLPQDDRCTAVPWNASSHAFDLIINATSMSLHQQQFLLDKSLVHAGTTTYDMFYSADITTFNQWAHSAGVLQTFDGLGMLIHQAALGFELWRQVEPEVAPVLTALEKK